MPIKLKDKIVSFKNWISMYGNIPRDMIRHHNKLKRHFIKQKQYRNNLINQAHKAIRSDIKLDSRIQHRHHDDTRAIVYYPNGSCKSLASIKFLNRKEHSHE